MTTVFIHDPETSALDKREAGQVVKEDYISFKIKGESSELNLFSSDVNFLTDLINQALEARDWLESRNNQKSFFEGETKND